MRILGVDPGLDGALTLWQPAANFLAVWDVPTMGEGKQREVNGAQLIGLIESLGPDHAFIEKVTAMRGWGIASTFRFGACVGELRGALRALKIPMTQVTPKEWQRDYGFSGTDKERSRKRAIELWPAQAHFFARKKDHNRAESALIARYGARTLFPTTKGCADVGRDD